MGKLRNKKNSLKIDKAEIENKRECHKCVAFSFSYLTTNNAYNFDYFKRDTNNKNNARMGILSKLEKMCSMTWKELFALPRELGVEYEMISPSFKPKGYDLRKGEKIIISRFRANDFEGRIIGIKHPHCSIFHVIGYDFDFSAYDHG